MTLPIVDFDTAKELKELGFGLSEVDYVQLFSWYEADGTLNAEPVAFVRKKINNSPNHLGADTIDDFEANVEYMDNSLDECFLAPEQSLVTKWFRDVHKLSIEPVLLPKGYIACVVTTKGGYLDVVIGGSKFNTWSTYEEAELEGIQKTIQYLKENALKNL